MARSPNSRPDKGFMRELSKPVASSNVKKPFTYSKPVTPQSKDTNGMHTPHRLREFKSVKPENSFTAETTSHIKNRRGEK